jgi:hypothetical protein
VRQPDGNWLIGRPEELFVEPEVFEALAVVDAVNHESQPLELRLPADRAAREENDRPGIVLNQLLLDLPDQLLAPLHRFRSIAG